MSSAAMLSSISLATLVGCQQTPPPQRATVPPADTQGARKEREPVKPIIPTEPDNASNMPMPFDDVPLMNQQIPEEKAFVDAYVRVNRPQIVVFVNRTLEGDVIPVNNSEPVASVEYSRQATTGTTVERRTTDRDAFGRTDTTDRFETKGPGKYTETASVYLRPGQYDEVQAKSLDYAAMEAALTDWLSARGQVRLMSPLTARQRLTDQQVKDLQEGRPQVLAEVAEQLNADILVHVTARPTRQTQQGLEVRVICEALNTRGGQSIGRAIVDVPPPLDKPQLNKYTRFLARKLMDGMTGSWDAAGPNVTPAPNMPPEAKNPSNVAPAPPPSTPTEMPAPVPPPNKPSTAPKQ